MVHQLAWDGWYCFVKSTASLRQVLKFLIPLNVILFDLCISSLSLTISTFKIGPLNKNVENHWYMLSAYI